MIGQSLLKRIVVLVSMSEISKKAPLTAIHLGPDAIAYLQGIARIEQQWLRKFAKVPPKGSPFRRQPEEDSVKAHIALLEQFIELVEQIPFPPEISVPVLWHTDLHDGNVMISEEDLPKTTGWLDWQGLVVAPLFTRSDFVDFCTYKPNEIFCEFGKMAMPDYPEGYGNFPSHRKEAVQQEMILAVKQKTYEVYMRMQVPLQWKALTFPFTNHVVRAADCAARSWYQAGHRLRDNLASAVVLWQELVPDSPPLLTFDRETLKRDTENLLRMKGYWERVDELKSIWKLGIDAWVSAERFEEIYKLSELERKRWNDQEAGGPYPFQDGAPCFSFGS